VSRADEVREFSGRLFSGRDLYHLMEKVGVGTGATEHLVQEAMIEHRNFPDTIRALDGPRIAKEIREQAIHEVIGAILDHPGEFRAKEHIANYIRKQRRDGRL